MLTELQVIEKFKEFKCQCEELKALDRELWKGVMEHLLFLERISLEHIRKRQNKATD